MAIQPQPAPMGPIPPPPPDMCIECIHPNGTHFITTVADCQAIGGTLFGEPFPCGESESRSQQLKDGEKSA